MFYRLNFTFIRRFNTNKRGAWIKDDLFNIKYKIVVIAPNVLEFVFIVSNMELNRNIFGFIFNTIVNSNEYVLLGYKVKVSLMSGLSDGSWISIGSSFFINEKTSIKDFEDFYLSSLKSLMDRHYSTHTFSFLVTKVFPVKSKK